MQTISHVFIITGEPRQGKTSFVLKLAEKLNQLGYTTGGFVAPGEFRDNRRFLFNITDLKTGQTKPLCKRGADGSETTGPFTFFDEGQQFGKHLLEPENLRDCNFIVIDEIGPLELQGKGWADSVFRLLDKEVAHQIWVVRKSVVEDVIKKFNVDFATIFDITTINLTDAVRIISNGE